VLAAHSRLRSVLGFTPVKATGRLLLQVQISAEELAKLAGEEHRALVNASWRLSPSDGSALATAK
jgi:hypothetical protein